MKSNIFTKQQWENLTNLLPTYLDEMDITKSEVILRGVQHIKDKDHLDEYAKFLNVRNNEGQPAEVPENLEESLREIIPENCDRGAVVTYAVRQAGQEEALLEGRSIIDIDEALRSLREQTGDAMEVTRNAWLDKQLNEYYRQLDKHGEDGLDEKFEPLHALLNPEE